MPGRTPGDPFEGLAQFIIQKAVFRQQDFRRLQALQFAVQNGVIPGFDDRKIVAGQFHTGQTIFIVTIDTDQQVFRAFVE